MPGDDVSSDAVPVFVGESRLLHYWPWAMVTVGAVPLLLGNIAALVVFGLPAAICAVLVPWRFAVFGSGIVLWFGFGKRRFVAKEAVTVRTDPGGTVVLPRGAERFGYPLTNGLVERDPDRLRFVLRAAGYDVAP